MRHCATCTCGPPWGRDEGPFAGRLQPKGYPPCPIPACRRPGPHRHYFKVETS